MPTIQIDKNHTKTTESAAVTVYVKKYNCRLLATFLIHIYVMYKPRFLLNDMVELTLEYHFYTCLQIFQIIDQ